MTRRESEKLFYKWLKTKSERNDNRTGLDVCLNWWDAEYDLLSIIKLKLEQMFYHYKNDCIHSHAYLINATNQLSENEHKYFDTKLLNKLENFELDSLQDSEAYDCDIWLGNRYVCDNELKWYIFNLRRTLDTNTNEYSWFVECTRFESLRHSGIYLDRLEDTKTKVSSIKLNEAQERYNCKDDTEFLNNIRDIILAICEDIENSGEKLTPDENYSPTKNLHIYSFVHDPSIEVEDFRALSKETKEKCLRGNLLTLKAILKLRRIVKNILALDDMNFQEKYLQPFMEREERLEAYKKGYEDYMSAKKDLYHKFAELMSEAGEYMWD